MAAEMTSDDWSGLLNEVRRTAPVVGRLVRVTAGKHRGKVGRVFWSGVDRFARVYTAGAEQAWIREAGASYGYRMGVETEGGEKFFTKSSYAVVCVEEVTQPTN